MYERSRYLPVDDGRSVWRAPRKQERDRRHSRIDRDRHVGSGRHVIYAQQVETGEQTAEHCARDVAAVEESKPRHALRRRLHPARNRRQGRAHEHRWRQEAHCAQHRAEQNRPEPVSDIGDVQVAQRWQREQDENAECADSEFQARVDAKRVPVRRDDAREQKASRAHATHECGQQDTERYRRCPDYQLHQLKPDDLVDQRGAAAADEQKQDAGQESWRSDGLNGAWPFFVTHFRGAATLPRLVLIDTPRVPMLQVPHSTIP